MTHHSTAAPNAACTAGEKYFFDFKVWLDAKRGLYAVRPPSMITQKELPLNIPCDYHIEITTG